MTQPNTGSPRYDHALAAGLQILAVLDSSPGATKPRLLGKVTFIVLEAIERYEVETMPRVDRTSVN
jgi:hypothetical protein